MNSEMIPCAEISQCRSCSQTDLLEVVDLGILKSCGVFVDDSDLNVPSGQLRLLICTNCTLVQLDRNFDLNSLFNIQYGYETGLNSSMANHITSLASDAISFLDETSGLRILDIGSNDGTLLNSLTRFRPELSVGVDPNISRLKQNYNKEIITFSDFFSTEVVQQISDNLGSEFNLITSIAMFYDLIDPNEFVRNIKKLLSSEGIWVLELSNVFSMLEANSIDTICHEHLEYYSAFSINVLLAKHALKVVRFEENQANGGSMQLYISHLSSGFDESSVFLDRAKIDNKPVQLILDLFRLMLENVTRSVELVTAYISSSNLPLGTLVAGFGASTKGNTFLQMYPDLASKLEFIAEINPKKFGKYTPGTDLKIAPEPELSEVSDKILFLVLPWHFKESILNRYADAILANKVEFIFALPEFEIYPQKKA
jgi:2-polyprenyl-3-methyl-5-hydroxy-6-metoxy-1,4-benzoquinol methylase